MKAIFCFTALALFCISGSSAAQSHEGEFLKDTLKAELVVVTGSRTITNMGSLPASISVVTREMIERSGKSDVFSILPGYVPGLFVTQRGAAGYGVYSGSAGNISLRGIGASPTTQVLVTIDGMPQLMGINGHSLPDALRTAQAERIEVVRGPASTIYGSNAMGGVINIITRSPQEGVKTELGGEYGSFNTQRYRIDNSLKKGRFSSHIGVGHDRTDGHRQFSQFRLTNSHAKVGYELSEKYRIFADGSLSGFLSTDPGTIENPALNDTMTADVLRFMGTAGIESRQEKGSGALTLFYNYGDHELYYGWNSRDQSFGASLYHSLSLFEGSTITAGTDLRRYGGRATDSSKPLFRLDKFIGEAAGYVLARQELFGKLNISGGVRLEHNTHFGNQWVPQGGISYAPANGSTLKASIAKGYRNPSIRELYIFAPNAGLKPESMVNYELAYTYWSPGGKFQGELAGYISDGSNIIETEFRGGIPYESRNSGSFLNKGAEGSVSYIFEERLRFSANYSYIHMSKPILASPRQQINLSGEYDGGKWGLRADMQYVDRLYIRTGAQPATDSFTLLGAKVSYTPSAVIELYLRGDNLLDRRYQMNYGYPLPGISFSVGVGVKI